MHEIPLLINIAVALAAALVGGLLARRAHVPPLVGYLVAGMAIGPFTPGFRGDIDTISQLAELGVIFLMFGVGLHFSLGDLWRVRGVAIPGALAQMAITTALGYGVGRWWGWSGEASIVLGLAISIASTVVLLRSLMDEGLLDSRHGRIAVGWLVLEDLATVLLLLILPALASGPTGVESPPLGLTLLKAAVFIVLMLLLGARVVPWVLLRIARMQSRELFLLVALTLSLGIALTAATLFGVSIALGAFLAGVVVAESPLSHQVGADVLPFREAFAVLFFVSVGMLVNPRDLIANAGEVALLTTLIVLGKGLVALAFTLLLRQPALTALVVAAGLAQIGEFSFILGQSAVRLHMLSEAQYSLILAAALLSITVNPLLFKLVPGLERSISRRLRARSMEATIVPTLRDHVVVVGAGRVGSHIVDVLGRMGVPRLVVESDAATVEDLQRAGVPVLYGDAGNSEILDHAGLSRARALVVTIPDDPAAGLAVAAARKIAPSLPIVARASEAAGVAELGKLGADDVIHPELEGGLELLRHTLLHVGFPLREVQRYAQVVRRESYATGAHSDAEHEALHALVDAARNLDITWVRIPDKGPASGRTLAEVDLRARTGASVVALYRDGALVPSPTPDFKLEPGDRLGLIGDPAHVQAAETLVAGDGGLEGVDEAKKDAFAGKMVGILNGAALALMTSVGRQTGLFETMAALPPSTSEAIAGAAHLDERYVREWLGAMVTGGIVEFDAVHRTYVLPPEHAAVLTNAAGGRNMARFMQYIPMLGEVEADVIHSFRHGGGVPYARYPRFQALMAESSGLRFDHLLLQRVVPLTGMADALGRGIDVLDIGCGQGHAANLLARAFPRSRFTGYDFSEAGIAAARAEAAALGCANVRFAARDVAALDETERYDLITAFDVIHDQAKPHDVLREVARALRPDGTFLMVDVRASSDLEGNIGHPLGPFLYGMSTMHCMTVSLALNGAGLGTVWGEQTALAMLREAGFASVAIHRLGPDDPLNNYYVAGKTG